MGLPQIIWICLTVFAVLSMLFKTWKQYRADDDINTLLGNCLGGLLYHAGINALLIWGGFFAVKC